MYTAQEVPLGWWVAPRIDIADVIFFGALAVGTLPFVLRRGEARPWLARTALVLTLAALWFLPEWETKLERLGRQAWGAYGDRGSSGIEFFALIGLASATLGFCARCASDGPSTASRTIGMVFAAAAVEALIPRSMGLWSAFAAAALTLPLIFVPAPTEELPS